MPTVNHTIKRSIYQYPEISISRGHLLAFWMLNGTSYMQWYTNPKTGYAELFNTSIEPDKVVLARREKRAKYVEEPAVEESDVIPWLQARLPHLSEADVEEVVRNTGMSGRAGAILWQCFTRIPEYPYTSLFLVPAAMKIPDNIAPDWLSAIREILDVALSGDKTGKWTASPSFTFRDIYSLTSVAIRAQTDRFQNVCRRMLMDIDVRFPNMLNIQSEVGS